MFEVRFEDERIQLPATFTYEQTVQALLERTRVPALQLVYLDDEAEWITVDNQLEFEEGLSTVQATNSFFKIAPKDPDGAVIAALPLYESCMSSKADQESVVLQKFSADEGARPVEKTDAYNQFGSKPTVDQTSFTEVRQHEIGTGVDQADAHSNTEFIEVVESGSQHFAPEVTVKKTGPEIVEKGVNPCQRQSQSIVTDHIPQSSIALETHQVVEQLHQGAQTNLHNIEEDLRQMVQAEVSLFMLESQRLNVRSFPGTRCTICEASPLTNAFYTCAHCPQLQLCENCEADLEHEHDLLKNRFMPIPVPEPMPVPMPVVVEKPVIEPTAEEKVYQAIKSMGFNDEDEIQAALVQADYDLNKATSLLLGI